MTQRHEDVVLREVAPALAGAAFALARRFAAGGTLWCWSPASPEHAQHVAVEFVHPVVMGARALPAVALLDADADAAGSLRHVARAGDVLLVVASGDVDLHGTLCRAEAWGIATIRIGVGPPPQHTGADHVLWLSDDPSARYDGRLVLGYHLLWELTQVCFEHPGLLAIGDDETFVCTTCADEGRLAEVVRGDDRDAMVRTAVGLEQVSTAMVGPVLPGDLVLVHAGTAITRVDP